MLRWIAVIVSAALIATEVSSFEACSQFLKSKKLYKKCMKAEQTVLDVVSNFGVDLSYNPDQDSSTPEMAVRHGYPAESYTVETADGYLLTLHRIPCGKSGCQGGRGKGQPVFLQHGLLSSSADWLLSGPDKALAYILADAGYDVWLGNARGNTYSRRHVNLSSEDSAYWDFSWHEMALFDIPAEIDFVYSIRSSSERNLLYIGHSMGTTMAFALLSTKPEFNDKIEAVFALAPVAFMSHVRSPLRLLAPFSTDLQWILRFLGADQFLPQNWVLRYLARYGCDLLKVEKVVCENAIFVLSGFDEQQFNQTLLPVIFGHTPAGTSTKTVIHFAQEIHEDGRFQNFDYGVQENHRRYGQERPPIYEIENIRTPVSLIYALNDWLASPLDVRKLAGQLTKSPINMFKVPNADFNHIDFMWGVDAKTLVYDKLLILMEHYH